MQFKLVVFFLICWLLLLVNSVTAQDTFSISGSVLDASSKESIAGAQIYLTGTTIGTTSNSEGMFELDNIPEGIYELSASFLGYETASFNLFTNDLKETYFFELEPKVYELKELMVTANMKEWQQNFEEFRKAFIGTGPFSKDTKIKNSEVLSFDFDPNKLILTASASDRLIIENSSLGYDITYFLDYFIINYRNNSTFYFGRPLFEIKSSSRKRKNKRWISNRNKAYQGSFLHYTKSLIAGNALEEKFISRGEKREEKARYLSSNTISENIYFSQVDSSTYMFKFINFINITFEAEKEDVTYLEYIWNPLSRNPRTVTAPQNSSFTLTKDSVLIDKSGYIYDPLAIILDGYWSFENISDMVPINFVPEEK